MGHRSITIFSEATFLSPHELCDRPIHTNPGASIERINLVSALSGHIRSFIVPYGSRFRQKDGLHLTII